MKNWVGKRVKHIISGIEMTVNKDRGSLVVCGLDKKDQFQSSVAYGIMPVIDVQICQKSNLVLI